MSFQPVIPVSGIAGWSFLKRTAEVQQNAFEQGPALQRDLDYFHENIGNVKTPEDLVSDRRLLSVALGAFGLDSEIDNRYFINKVLSDGSLNSDALANRLADKRFLAFTKAFGFGDFDTPNTQLSDFPEQISEAYKTRQFEIAVGDQDNDLRLAMNMDREMTEIAADDLSDSAKWYTILGSSSLRQAFDTAFGLPDSFAALDLDKQVETYKEKLRGVLGTDDISALADGENRETLIHRFLARSQIDALQSTMSPAATALSLLQAIPRVS